MSLSKDVVEEASKSLWAKPKKRCDTCRFWKRDHASVNNKGIGNLAPCTVLIPQTSGFYDANPATPFWAQNLIHLTASFHGEDCATWSLKSNG